MKTSITLSIPKPCIEKWENFTSTAHGGFCGSCNKEVVDFSRMSDHELLTFFSNRQTSTCGRFRLDQLRSYALFPRPDVRTGFTLFKISLVCVLMLLINKPSFAQSQPTRNGSEAKKVELIMGKSIDSPNEFTVAGVVTSSDDGLALPGVNIYLKNATVGTSSDSEGKFEFPKKLKAGDILVFSFIGMETQEYVVPVQSASSMSVKLDLKMEMACEVFMGEVAVNEIYTKPSTVKRLMSKVKAIF